MMIVRQITSLAFLLLLTPLAQAGDSPEWGTVPLGGVAERHDTVKTPVKQPLRSRRERVELPGQPLELIGRTGSELVIVIPSRANPSEKLAGEELQKAFKRISGVTVPIFDEGKLVFSKEEESYRMTAGGGERFGRAVLVGDLALTRSLGVHAEALPVEGYRVRIEANLVCIVGSDQRPDGQRQMGTYFGALAFLEEELGVRWLWPGQNGEVYPKRESIEVARFELTDSPALGQRRLRNGGAVALAGMEPEDLRFRDPDEMKAFFKQYATASSTRRIVTALSFLQKPMESYLGKIQESHDWFRYQRTGGSFRLRYTHAYDDWHERYGTEHPEWFALQPDGSRKPASPIRIRLCKSNHALTSEIGAEMVRRAAADPAADSISISPNDGGAENFFCMCADCRSLDPSNGDPVNFSVKKEGEKFNFRYPSLTDRVVDFYNRIAEAATASRPDLKLGAYAYSYYRTPPLQRKVHPNIIVGFIGLGYFDDSRLQRDRQSWEGWTQAANRLFLRPNALHLGHAFPANFARRLDRDIKRCYETGMMGADFDSIVHHWATHGLNYYVLAKLLWDPARKVDELIDDYCESGFGPAARPVKAYFDRLEKLTDEAAARVGEEIEEGLREEEIVDKAPNPLDSFLKHAPEVYTPERIAGLEALLEEAAGLVKGDAEVSERVRFLQTGLRYGRLQSQLYSLLAKEKRPSPELLALFEERQNFFRETFENSFYAVGLVHIARREAGLYKRYGKLLPAAGEGE